MTALKEFEALVAELVEQTRSGTLEWSDVLAETGDQPRLWIANRNPCRFELWKSEGKLMMVSPRTHMVPVCLGSGDTLSPLLSLLGEMFDAKVYKQEELIAHALACLKSDA